MTKLKARAVKNRVNKYNVYINYQGEEMIVNEKGKILTWNTKEGAQEYIFANRDRLELVE